MQNRPESLDPADWEPVREFARRIVDDAIDYTRGVRDRPVWQNMPPEVRAPRYLAERIEATPDLKLCFPPAINIVCFRYNPGGLPEAALKRLNTEIMVRIQESGVAAVSDTTVRGRHCLRAALNNHRTTRADLDILTDEVARQGAALVGKVVHDWRAATVR